MSLRVLLLVLVSGVLAACSAFPPTTGEATTDAAAVNEALAYCPRDEVQLAQYQPPAADDIWDRIRAGYQFDPTISHPRIDHHLSWYSRHPEYFMRVSARAERYLFHIVEELEAEELPLELALLPIVESAFDPFAYSHGRASGMWQFIPSTGRLFGLKQNWWYDGRRDVVASTEAAIRFLKYLHRRFDGDWMLALAAYNTGEGNVGKAIRRNQRAGKPTDFFSLRLPRETRAYVPQLLALAKIVADPARYEIELASIPNEPHFQAVAVDAQIDLAQAARLAGLTIDELYLLNPGFNRWATDPKGPHRLLVPVARAAAFEQALAALPPEQRLGWERYKVKPGDSLILIAKHFNTTPGALKRNNHLRGDTIRVGQTLLIPVAKAPAEQYVLSEPQRRERIQENARGQDGTRKTYYEVREGDTLWDIARAFDVNLRRLAKWNAMAPRDPLRPGQRLVVWAEDSRIREVHAARRAVSPVIRKVNYQVRRGDSLARIAGKFNLSVNDILRWNPIERSGYLHPGQSITLFVDVRQTN